METERFCPKVKKARMSTLGTSIQHYIFGYSSSNETKIKKKRREGKGRSREGRERKKQVSMLERKK